MTTGRKLAIGGMIVAGLTAYLAYRGAAASWQYYLTADECLAERASLAGHRLRVSGRIAPGSLAIDKDRTRASFALEADGPNLKVVCPGPLPDNLADGVAVLVEGRVDDTGLLHGQKVMTRCASKYQSQPPSPSEPASTPARVASRPTTAAALHGTMDAQGANRR